MRESGCSLQAAQYFTPILCRGGSSLCRFFSVPTQNLCVGLFSGTALFFLRRKMTNAHGRTTAAVQARPVLPSSCSQPLGARDAILSDLTHSQEQRTAAVYVSLAPLRSPLPISSSLSSPPIARPLLSALLCCLRRMLCFEQQKKKKKQVARFIYQSWEKREASLS